MDTGAIQLVVVVEATGAATPVSADEGVEPLPLVTLSMDPVSIYRWYAGETILPLPEQLARLQSTDVCRMHRRENCELCCLRNITMGRTCPYGELLGCCEDTYMTVARTSLFSVSAFLFPTCAPAPQEAEFSQSGIDAFWAQPTPLVVYDERYGGSSFWWYMRQATVARALRRGEEGAVCARSLRVQCLTFPTHENPESSDGVVQSVSHLRECECEWTLRGSSVIGGGVAAAATKAEAVVRQMQHFCHDTMMEVGPVHVVLRITFVHDAATPGEVTEEQFCVALLNADVDHAESLDTADALQMLVEELSLALRWNCPAATVFGEDGVAAVTSCSWLTSNLTPALRQHYEALEKDAGTRRGSGRGGCELVQWVFGLPAAFVPSGARDPDGIPCEVAFNSPQKALLVGRALSLLVIFQEVNLRPFVDNSLDGGAHTPDDVNTSSVLPGVGEASIVSAKTPLSRDNGHSGSSPAAASERGNSTPFTTSVPRGRSAPRRCRPRAPIFSDVTPPEESIFVDDDDTLGGPLIVCSRPGEHFLGSLSSQEGVPYLVSALVEHSRLIRRKRPATPLFVAM